MVPFSDSATGCQTSQLEANEDAIQLTQKPCAQQ